MPSLPDSHFVHLLATAIPDAPPTHTRTLTHRTAEPSSQTGASPQRLVLAQNFIFRAEISEVTRSCLSVGVMSLSHTCMHTHIHTTLSHALACTPLSHTHAHTSLSYTRSHAHAYIHHALPPNPYISISIIFPSRHKHAPTNTHTHTTHTHTHASSTSWHSSPPSHCTDTCRTRGHSHLSLRLFISSNKILAPTHTPPS